MVSINLFAPDYSINIHFFTVYKPNYACVVALVALYKIANYLTFIFFFLLSIYVLIAESPSCSSSFYNCLINKFFINIFFILISLIYLIIYFIFKTKLKNALSNTMEIVFNYPKIVHYC